MNYRFKCNQAISARHLLPRPGAPVCIAKEDLPAQNS